MLAYELYLGRKGEGVTRPQPVKKVFVSAKGNGLKIELDSNPIESYGLGRLPETKTFQECLAMPLSNQAEVGLPSRMTGTASKRPYISLYGIYKNGKVTISIKGRKPSGKNAEKLNFTYRASINGGDGTEDHPEYPPSVTLRLDREHYWLDNKTLHQAYQEDNIIDAHDAFPSKIFLESCRRFIDFCRERKLSTHLEGLRRQLSFELVILPYSMRSRNVPIQYRENKDLESSEPMFVDAFDTKVTGFSSKTTQTAKFLSFDDRAFTINCTKGKDFYRHLGIGRETLENINLPLGDCFNISGLLWYFADLTNPHFRFERSNSGIYDQLMSNYRLLREKAGISAEVKSIMKVVCLKKTQAKLEVLLDTNLTMDQLEKILHLEGEGISPLHQTSGASEERRSLTRHAQPPMALETLIVKRTGRDSLLWHDYLLAVQHLITATPMDRSVLINMFSKILKENIISWVHDLMRGRESTNRFFERSMFCIGLLTKKEEMSEMNPNEEYAFKIGKIAGKYVQFKQKTGEATHSTADILTYTKYDRDRLRHVYSRVCTGICLGASTSEKPNYSQQEMTQFLKDNTPSKEIEDDKAHEDYSYFFYKGVFDSSKSEVNQK